VMGASPIHKLKQATLAKNVVAPPADAESTQPQQVEQLGVLLPPAAPPSPEWKTLSREATAIFGDQKVVKSKELPGALGSIAGWINEGANYAEGKINYSHLKKTLSLLLNEKNLKTSYAIDRVYKDWKPKSMLPGAIDVHNLVENIDCSLQFTYFILTSPQWKKLSKFDKKNVRRSVRVAAAALEYLAKSSHGAGRVELQEDGLRVVEPRREKLVAKTFEACHLLRAIRSSGPNADPTTLRLDGLETVPY